MNSAYIGLGSNLQEPQAQIERALHGLDRLPTTHLLRCSNLYKTPPWGMLDQPDFVNAVAEIETQLEPRELLDALLALEQQAGRVREEARWGPRVLDLDILLYANCVLNEPGLQLPHPRLHERAFVLLPFSELMPKLMISGYGTIAELLARTDVSACQILSKRTTAGGE